AALAALGAGLEVAVDTIDHSSHLSTVAAAFTVAVPVTVFLVVAGPLHAWMTRAAGIKQRYVFGGAALVLASAGLAGVFTLAGSVAVMGLLVAALVAASLILPTRSAHRPGPARPS